MFKLDFDITASSKKIGIGDDVYLIGSCFSDTMADKLTTYKWKCLANPFGTLYNPVSIFKILGNSINELSTTEHQGIFYHWDAHGEVSAMNETLLHKEIANRSAESQRFLAEANWLIITLGTAFVYRLVENGEVVANCHKAHTDVFTKELISVGEIVDGFGAIHRLIPPHTQMILTVSPVRHIKDGLVENNLSKSVLIQATHQIVNTYERTHYFPSYEILIDELRDYRFYKRDRIHPSEEAVDYIWEKFTEATFKEEANQFMKQWDKIQRALQHRPFHPTSVAHQKFLKETIRKLDELKEVVDISNERELLKQQLV